jgi:serine phosphatase RsbU (regulator of sigma subunit)
MQFEFDKKESLAKAEQDKKESLAKAEQEKKDAIVKKEKEKQKIITYSVSVGLILVLALAIFIFRGYRQKQKANLLLADKNKIIEEKNKDITDSINYALRIQHSMLPSKEEINTSLPQNFILFKPKAIVSGDFYFFHKNNNEVFIAAADCTGHGVPGALMGMVGSSKLNEAVSISTDTSEILRHLNKGIKTSLRQSEGIESTKDGMDIALCLLDIENRSIKFSGANRPMWIIRKDKNELEEIKGTKRAIGGFTHEHQEFESHNIQLYQGDTFYIFSDGYGDSFSGHDRKKLTIRKFAQILLDIQQLSMIEQEKHLDSFIENWRGGTDQVDDILVIGVRL